MIDASQIVSRSFAVAAFRRCQTQPYHCTEQLLATADLGRAWVDITPPGFSKGIAITDINFTDPQHGWVIGYSCNAPGRSAIWTTGDGGTTWSRLGTPPVSCADGTGHSLDLLTSTSGWMASWGRGTRGRLSPIPGGEGSWTNGQRLPTPGDIEFVDPALGYLVGFPEAPVLYRTTDAGASWRVGQPALPGNATWGTVMSLPAAFSPMQTIEPIEIYRRSRDWIAFDTSTNGGATWSLGSVLRPPTSSPTAHGTVSTSIPTATSWWVTIGFPSRVYVTRNAGGTWHKSVTAFHGVAEIHALDGRSAWLVDHHSGASTLYLTTDGGRSWKRLHPGGS